MPEGLHRIVSARSRVRVPGPSRGPVAQLVEQDVFPKPRRRNLNIRRECRPGLHSLWYERSWLFTRPATEQSWRMQMGIHRWRPRPAVRVRKFSSFLVAGTDQTGECRSDYMGRAPAPAGGRRFDSASGQPDSSVRMSGQNSSPTVSSAANAVGTTSCRRFESGRILGSVAQRIEQKPSRKPLSPA